MGDPLSSAPSIPIRVGSRWQKGEFYLPRPEEQDKLVKLAVQGITFQLYGPRTTGKSSLIHWAQHELLPAHDLAAVTWSCASLGVCKTDAEWVDRLIQGYIVDAHGRAGLKPPEPSPLEPAAKLVSFLCGWYTTGPRLLFVLDELDLGVYRHRSWLPALLRSVGERLHDGPDQPRPSLCLVGLRRLHDYANPHLGDASPVGPEIRMGDFSIADATTSELTKLLGPTHSQYQAARAAVERILTATGGQALLTMKLIADLRDALSVGSLGADVLTRVVDDARCSNLTPPLDTIEKCFLDPEDWNAEQALAAYERLLNGAQVSTSESGAPALQVFGLCRARQGQLEIKGPLFRDCLDQEWVARTREEISKRRTDRRSVPAPVHDPPNVFVINTGGTLGMVRKGDKVVQPEDFTEFSRSFPELESYLAGGAQPFAVDSVNVTPAHWVQLAQLIRAVHEKNPRYGFVVVHGTDTMAFTASAMAFAFGQRLDFPIVFTGSQTTPDVKHGDARTNLLRACLVAREPIPEVTIAFGDHILRAVNARKRDERQFAGFEPVGHEPLGDLSEKVEVVLDRLRTKWPAHERPTSVAAWHNAGLSFVCEFASRVLTIQLIPGLEPDFYMRLLEDPAIQCSGIVIQVLGAGNVTSVGSYGFHHMIRTATNKDIPVLLTSRFRWRPGAAREYQPAAGAIEVGAISGGEMTPEAAVTKLRWALGIAGMSPPAGRKVALVRDIMATNFVGELDGPLSRLEQT